MTTHGGEGGWGCFKEMFMTWGHLGKKKTAMRVSPAIWPGVAAREGSGRLSFAHGWAKKGEIPMLFSSAVGKRPCQGTTSGLATLYG